MTQTEHITLRELQRIVRQTLEERLALPVWVSAEVSEAKVNYSGHCYMELVEKDPASGRPAAQARAVIWRSNYPRIASGFEAATGTPIAAGIRILAKVLVSYHELYGFSLQILEIDPAYTLGEIERQRQQTIARLRDDGVWDINREVPLPQGVQRIAVVSSAQAAGYRDFCKELDASPYRFHTTLFDAFMQGDAAEDSIIAALCRIAEEQERFDAVVVIRGGGSRNDLACYDSYRLCSYIAQFPLPVVTGIGHDKDVSVADMVAHTALKTPTAVAGWLVAGADALCGTLNQAALRLHEAVSGLLHDAALRLERLTGDLRRQSGDLLTRSRLHTEHLAGQLPDAAGRQLLGERRRLDRCAEAVAARDPRQILRMGFAVVRRGGEAVVSARGLRQGDRLRIELSDGGVEVEVCSETIHQTTI